MNKFSNDLYGNKFIGIDTSRANMNRILNPSIRYYPKEDQYAQKPVMQEQDKTSVENPEEYRLSGAIIDAAGKAEVSAGTQMPVHNNNESDKNKSNNKPGFKLDFSNNNLLNGIILAEVLGKPKYFRKGRW